MFTVPNGVRRCLARTSSSRTFPRFPPENEVRSGLSAGGESQERTRLRNRSFRAILDGNKLVFGAENREESQTWLAIVWRVPLLSLCENEHFSNVAGGQPMNLPSIKRAGDSGHVLFQTENAISFSYLPILTELGNLP